MKTKEDDPKPLGCRKRGSRRKVYHNMNLPQKTREISSKQPHFTPKGTRERKISKPQT